MKQFQIRCCITPLTWHNMPVLQSRESEALRSETLSVRAEICTKSAGLRTDTLSHSSLHAGIPTKVGTEFVAVALGPPASVTVGEMMKSQNQGQGSATKATQLPPWMAAIQAPLRNSSGERGGVLARGFFFPKTEGLEACLCLLICFCLFPSALSSLVLSSVFHSPPTLTSLFLQNNLCEHPYTLLFPSFQHWLYPHFCPLYSSHP